MASLTFVTPILPEKGEAWRRFYQNLSGSRRTEYEESRQRLGITRECVWVAQTPQGEIAIASLETEDTERVILELAASDLPFDHWFREQILELHGLDVKQQLAKLPNELVFVWQTLQ